MAYQSGNEHDLWLMENAQILDQEVKVIAIGMNKELEKTQRINWKKSMESGCRKAIERPSKR